MRDGRYKLQKRFTSNCKNTLSAKSSLPSPQRTQISSSWGILNTKLLVKLVAATTSRISRNTRFLPKLPWNSNQKKFKSAQNLQHVRSLTSRWLTKIRTVGLQKSSSWRRNNRTSAISNLCTTTYSNWLIDSKRRAKKTLLFHATCSKSTRST